VQAVKQRERERGISLRADQKTNKGDFPESGNNNKYERKYKTAKK